MVLTGNALAIALILLALWLVLMLALSLRLVRARLKDHRPGIRAWLTVAGLGLLTVAVASLFLLHLSWISVDFSQRFGSRVVVALGTVLFWSTIVGFILSVAGSGKVRFVAVASSVVTGLWWTTLFFMGAISMGPSIIRHPDRILIPDGYVGWVKIRFGVKGAPSLATKDGILIFTIPPGALLETSSIEENGWAKDEYYYYSPDGSTHPLTETGWGAGGQIWNANDEWSPSPDGSRPTEITHRFFVGTEEQLKREDSSNSSSTP